MTNKVVVIDVSQKGFLGWSWRFGAKYLGGFDEVIEVSSTKEFYQKLFGRKIGELQIWSHGAPGQPVINSEALTRVDMLRYDIKTVWFRSCSVFQGEEGRRYANSLSPFFDVAAHTRIIGTFGLQSGLVGLRRGETAWWGDDEGISHPFAPRTIPCTTMSLPSWTWEK